jgi:TolA-binding protein
MGETLLQLGRYDDARQQFSLYLAAEPQGQYARSALFRLGESAYLAGNFAAAKTDLERFLAQYPKDEFNAYVLPYLGDIASSSGDMPTAARYFRDGLTRFPDGRLQDDCRFGLARALVPAGQADEAERLLTALAGKSSSPLADDAQFQLGALFYATGRHAAAAESLAAFDRQWPNSPLRGNARLGRGWALLKLQRFAEARDAFNSLADDAKVATEARYWLGMTSKAEQDWRRAAEILQGVAAVDEKHPLALAARFHAGDALLRAGDTAAAAQQFDRVIAVGQKDNDWFDDAIRGATQAAIESRNHLVVDRLTADYSRLCPQSPLVNDMTRLRARSLLERRQFDEAAQALLPLTTADDNEYRREDLYLLAVAYEGLRRYDEALRTIAPVLTAPDARLKADALLRQASILSAQKRYGDAIVPLEAYLAADPSGDGAVKARGELAIAYARTGQMPKAKKAYAELTSRHAGHALLPAATEQLAEAAYAAKDAEWAGQLFARLGELGRSGAAPSATPADTPAPAGVAVEIKSLSGLGWSQFKAGRFAEAEQTFAQLLAQNPPAALEAEAALVRGQSLEKIDRLDAALAMYDQVIDKHPKSEQHAQALLAAARLRDRLQQDAPAAALYEKLATLYPNFPQIDSVLYEWAWVLRELNRLDEADQLFDRLRTTHAQSRFAVDAAYRLAQRAFLAGDLPRAKLLVAEVLAGKGDASVQHYARLLQGQIAVSEGNWEAVQGTFETVARQAEGNEARMAEYWIAEALYRRDQLDAAEARFAALAEQTHEQREPWLAMIPLRRAQVLSRQGKWAEARRMAEPIAENYPGFEQQYEVDYLLGRCLHAAADMAGARAAFARVVRSPAGAKTETAAMAQWWTGETYYHQKKYDEAFKEYMRVVILYAFPRWQAAALLQAGKCQEALGDRQEAVRLYTQVITEHPDSQFAPQAREALRSAAAGPPANAGSRSE